MKNSPTALFSDGCFVFPARVYYEDTDAAGVVYYANYLKFFERCRTEWIRSLGFGQAELASAHGLAFMVRKVTADYLRPARLDDDLRVGLRVASLGRARVVLSQWVARPCSGGAEDVLVQGTVELACVSTRTLRPVAIPPFLHTLLLPI